MQMNESLQIAMIDFSFRRVNCVKERCYSTDHVIKLYILVLDLIKSVFRNNIKSMSIIRQILHNE